MNFGARSRERAPKFMGGGADRVRTDDLRLAKPPLSQLSYGPVTAMRLPAPAFAQGAPAVASRHSSLSASDGGWWAWVDSNYRPHAYQACALTN
jgi:hypothetical protein